MKQLLVISLAYIVIHLIGCRMAERDYSGVYHGTIPCADCSGIRMELQLQPDSTYILSQEYLEHRGKFVEAGRWRITLDDSQRTVLALAADMVKQKYFLTRGADELEMLDGAGKTIDSKLNYLLRRKSAFP